MQARRWIWVLAMLAATVALADTQGSDPGETRKVPDTYKAVTANMTPAGVELKADILEWSGEDARKQVVEALAQGGDASKALSALPTLGVVWRSGSAVGEAIKYAERKTAPDGGEQITLVTDKAIGSTSFEPWKAKEPGEARDLSYSVIQMSTNGEGTMSLGAKVRIDAERNMISLERGNAPALLTKVRKEPKPYWARAN